MEKRIYAYIVFCIKLLVFKKARFTIFDKLEIYEMTKEKYHINDFIFIELKWKFDEPVTKIIHKSTC